MLISAITTLLGWAAWAGLGWAAWAGLGCLGWARWAGLAQTHRHRETKFQTK